MINLHIQYPDDETETIPLKTGVFQIGRTTDNDIILRHDTISRVHAELTVSKDCLRIKDLHSSSGTRLNGKPCSFEKKIKSGDQLLLGLVNLTLTLEGQGSTAQEDDEKTRAFQQGELASVLQEFDVEPQQNYRKIIIALCCLILALSLYIFFKS
jgi:pSer/pThr/pTyr-binding forkhead associated (FHA) protein